VRAAVRGQTRAAWLAVAALEWWESWRPLRQRVEPRLIHTTRNLAVAGLAAAAVHLVEMPIVRPAARVVARRRMGLVPSLHAPPWLAIPLTYALMDYTLYIWHVLAHRYPPLWRFHVVHHADRDLDASTALRFHFGELLLSIPWRVAQIVAIGTTPAALATWQGGTFLSILFHHSNAKLPMRIERLLSRLIVTPRMHGIHHSTVASHMNSNWSSGLAAWDHLHGTFQWNVPQDTIRIGVSGYRRATDVALSRLIALPFLSADNSPSPAPNEDDEAPETPPTDPPPEPIKEPPAPGRPPYIVMSPPRGRPSRHRFDR
jgi:sterol desaturase/sphingolipid hydroxylase (fatty acid hydroxylase superfamily)